MGRTVSCVQGSECVNRPLAAVGEPYFFGIRHLSPAGAYFLRRFLEEVRPKLVLIEGPGDFAKEMKNLSDREVCPPVAILAYTKQAPVRTLFYPLAEYSPEYQAILWCREHGTECRFMDLPSSLFLAAFGKREEAQGESAAADDNGERDGEREERLSFVYNDFWEQTLEHAAETDGYRQGANLFGASLRKEELSEGAAESETQSASQKWERQETQVREAYMRKTIRENAARGIAPEEIVVITGAYHVEGLKNWREESREDTALLGLLEPLETSHTLMPYSYYRLSTRSGYGAGNEAPAYFELIWRAKNKQEPLLAAYEYLSRLASRQREQGNPVSSAQVIEAVRLAKALASLRGGLIPTLSDLRDAAITCMGEGSFAAISIAAADTEIGTKIGTLPEGVSKTSVQDDFYRKMKELRLEKYRSVTVQTLSLDLRENRRAAGKQTAFLDLHRSYFFHCLRVLGVSFAVQQPVKQDGATWAEVWNLCWSPEAEMALVESALRGDTVEQAASFALRERCGQAAGLADAAAVIEDAFACGMAAAAHYATGVLQAMAVDAASVTELAAAGTHLSVVIGYGTIRRVDGKPLLPLLSQIYYRCCLILPDSCFCDEKAAKEIAQAMDSLNRIALFHDFLDQELWTRTLWEIAMRDNINAGLSGIAAAILMERGLFGNEALKTEVRRRLSPGIPADMGAGWFEGLASKNRRTLIAKLSLWEELDAYLEQLDDAEFKRALLFLRRAFADFNSAEKDAVAQNLGEIWGLNKEQVSEALNAAPKELEELAESLEDFDFDF